ncbi:MAG: ABC transporter ATP-binding protein [Anaplasma ovis]
MRALLSYMWPHFLYFLLSYLAVIASSGAILALGYSMNTLVDTVSSAPNSRPPAVIFFLIVTMSTSSFLRIWLSGRGAELVVRDLRKRLYDKIVVLSQSVLENTSTAVLMSRLTTDMAMLQAILSGSMLVIFRNITVLVGSAAMLAHTNTKLTGYIVLMLPILWVIVALLGRRVRHFSRLLRERIEKLAHFGEETCRGIGVIQAFTAEDHARARFASLLDANFRIAERYLLWRALLVTLILSSAAGSVGIVLWAGVKEVGAQSMSAGSLLSFVFYAVLAAGAVNGIGDNVQDLQKAARIAEDVLRLLCIDVGMSDAEDCVDISTVRRSVELHNVTFFYPSKADAPALRGVSLTMHSGERVAIVGYSGAGKSTITDLLLRFYDVSSGSITIDGVDIRKISLRSLRSIFCVVPQSPVIFSGTILDNIAYGADRTYTNKQLEEAVERANIADFIHTLPNKFDTFVGEKGVCLSEGQRQRIVIARAILRSPEVLILDEATSALDSDNERKVQAALCELMRGKLMITIAHRLSTVADSDKIVVLDNGAIKEIGTHDSLIQDENSLYARLVKLQLLQYRG